MEITKEIVMELLHKVIGEIRPCADSAIDGQRIGNLKLFIDVFDEMHTMIDDIPYEWKDTKYGSVQPFIKACDEQLDRMGIPRDWFIIGYNGICI